MSDVAADTAPLIFDDPTIGGDEVLAQYKAWAEENTRRFAQRRSLHQRLYDGPKNSEKNEGSFGRRERGKGRREGEEFVEVSNAT